MTKKREWKREERFKYHLFVTGNSFVRGERIDEISLSFPIFVLSIYRQFESSVFERKLRSILLAKLECYS